MCANCARVMRGGQYVYTVAYKYTRSFYRTRSPWHCLIVQCTRTRRPGLAWPAFRVSCNGRVHVRANLWSHERSDQPRAPLEGDDLQDSSGVLPRPACRSREKLPCTRSHVSIFFLRAFFFKVKRDCMRTRSMETNRRFPGLLPERDSAARSSNELDEVWKANWSRTRDRYLMREQKEHLLRGK